MNSNTFTQLLKESFKSNDTEEWLDRVFTRPIGYLWAKLFQRLGVHPNVVTVLSILIGISSFVLWIGEIIRIAEKHTKNHHHD